MYCSVCLWAIAHTYVRVEPDALRRCKRVIDMNETAHRCLDMLLRQTIRYATEFQRVRFIERCSIESDDPIPAALYGYGLASQHGASRSLRPEIWEGRSNRLMTVAISQRKCIIVVRRFCEVKGTGRRVFAISSSEELRNIFGLGFKVSATSDTRKQGCAYLEYDIIQKEDLVEFDSPCR